MPSPSDFDVGALDRAQMAPDPAADERRRALTATREQAMVIDPEAAAKALGLERTTGVPMAATLDAPTAEPKAVDWGALVDESPALAKALVRPGVAAEAHDDIEQLVKLEKSLRWGPLAPVVAKAEAVADRAGEIGDAVARKARQGWRNGQLSTIAAAQRKNARAGLPPDPSLEEQARAVEAGSNPADVSRILDPGAEGPVYATDQDLEKKADLSWTEGILPAGAEQQAQWASRGIRYVTDKLAAEAQRKQELGMMGEDYRPPRPLAPGSISRVAADVLTVATSPLPMAVQAAGDEGNLFFREALRAGATPQAADEVAKLVEVVNGGLEFTPLALLLQKIPGLGQVSGGVLRDVWRRVFTSSTRVAALNRGVARLATHAATEGATEGLQEVSNILGEALASGTPVDFSKAAPRVAAAASAGVQGSLALGAAGNVAATVQDLREAGQSRANVALFERLAQDAQASALGKRDPQAVHDLAEDAAADGAAAPQTFSVQAGDLQKLFQEDGLTPEDVARKMPEVAKQLAQAAAGDDAATEIHVPMADFVTHIAPSKNVAGLAKNLRVGGGLTLAEAEQVEASAKEFQAAQAKATPEEKTPGQRVYEEVFRVVSEEAKRTPEEAAQQAAIWTAVAETRAARGVSKDAWEYYQRAPLSARVAEDAGPGALAQPAMSLDSISQKAKDDGLKLNLFDRGETIHLDRIVIPEEARGSGKGSEVMRSISDHADATGKTVTLTPSTDFGATSKARLVEFYKRFGFVENKGKNKNLGISEEMYREPSKSLAQNFQSKKRAALDRALARVDYLGYDTLGQALIAIRQARNEYDQRGGDLDRTNGRIPEGGAPSWGKLYDVDALTAHRINQLMDSSEADLQEIIGGQVLAQRDSVDVATLPAATQDLYKLGVTPELHYLDDVTGVKNERAWAKDVAPSDKPMVAVVEGEGTKWMNDLGGGHQAGNAHFRMVAKALHDAGADVYKVGGGFRFYTNPEHYAAVMAKAAEVLPEKRFGLFGGIGETVEAAAQQMETEAIEARAVEGGTTTPSGGAPTRAARGAAPFGFPAGFDAKTLALPEDRAQGVTISDTLKQALAEMPPDAAFNAQNVEEFTGILNGDGFARTPSKAFEAAWDVDGLKAANLRLGKEAGNRMLDAVGVIMREEGGHEVYAGHRSGDEYGTKHDDRTILQAHLDRVQERARNAYIVVQLEDGRYGFINGIGISAGIGATHEAAESALVDAKQQRAAEGLRGDPVNAARFVVFDTEAEANAARDAAEGASALNEPGPDAGLRGEDGRGVREAGPDRVRRQGFPGLQGGQEVASLAHKSAGGQDRGFIEFTKLADQFKVTLTGKANLSTFLHESAHAFYEMVNRDGEAGHAESAADSQILREYAGATGATLTDAQKETIARGFEAYLWEGKAPSEKLAGVFARVEAWMRHVYRYLSGLGPDYVPLTQEVRDVFDRLLATDEEITTQASRLQLSTEFAGDEQARTLHERALEEARQDLKAETLSVLRTAVREDAARVTAEVTEEVNASPIHNAWEELSKRERLDGKPSTEGLKGRVLDRETLKAMGLPKGSAAKLRLISAMPSDGVTGGVIQPDDAAYLFGFDGGPAFVQALLDMTPRARQVQEETKRRLGELYPGYEMTPAWLEDHALKALHGKATEVALVADMDAVGRKVGARPGRSVSDALRSLAQDEVAGTKIVALDPERYRRAEVKAAKDWQKAMSEQDFQAAWAAKRRQLHSHHAWRAAAKARDEASKQREFLRGFEDIRARKRLGLAGKMYLEAMDALLEGVDLRAMTNRSAERSESLAAYIAKVEADAGTPVAIADELRARVAQKPWKLLTPPELQAIADAAKSIAHVAAFKRKLKVGKERRDFLEVTGELASHIQGQAGTSYAARSDDPQNPELGDRMLARMRQGNASLKKAEFIAMALDGGKEAGFAHSLIFEPVAQAQFKENELVKATAIRFRDSLLKRLDEDGKRLGTMVDFLGTSMRVSDVLALALNTGNKGNLQRLIDGYPGRGWTIEQIDQRLDALLSDADVRFINETWETVNQFWPEIVALEERTKGVAPEKVEASPRTLPSGRKLAGGYYPVVYDPRRSTLGERQNEQETTLFDNQSTRPAVEMGFTKQRADAVKGQGLLLDLHVVPRHLRKTAHYLSHYEALRSVDRVIREPRVSQAIKEAVGLEAYREIRPWLQDVANGGAAMDGPATLPTAILRHLRHGSSVVMYGAKMTSALIQTTGVAPAAYRIGPKHVVTGMVRFLTDLGKGHPFKEAAELSGELRDMERNMDRDLTEMMDAQMGSWGKVGQFKAEVVRFAMSWMGLVQRSVNTAVWWGAHEKALDDGHPNPVAYADSIVRTTQSAAGIKDLARIQRGPEAERMFVVAYSYMSVLHNNLAAPLRGETGLQKAGDFAARTWWIVTLPVLLDTMLRGKRPPDEAEEPEDWAKFLALEQFKLSTRGIPVVSSAVEMALEYDRDPRTAPWLQYGLKGVAAGAKAVMDDRPLSPSEIRDLINGVGVGLQIPTAALINLYRWASTLDEQSEPARNLALRAPAEFR